MSVLWNKIKSVCFFGAVFAACLLCGFAASARYVDAQTVYSYAKSGNYTALKYLGSGIDSEDAHGNTAVCLALADGNSRAYHTLLQYGANPNPRCSYAANIRNSSTTATGISSGGMSTTGWLLVGALVAGGVGIAVAAGGGGGGGGGRASAGSCDDTYMVSCPLGYSETGKTCRKDGKLLYECVLTDCSGYTLSFVPENCVIPEACRSGDVTTYRCATDGCKEGWHGPLCNIKDRCTYSTKECLSEEGYVESGEYCMSGDEKFVKCEERDCTGYEEGISVQHCTQYEECKSGHRNFARCDECEEGWDIATSCQEPSKCPYDTTECVSDEGFVETGNTCKSGDTTYVECAPRDCTGYNLSNVPEKCLHYDICITSEQQNVKRYINCTECMEGWVGEDCEDPDPCEGYSENCANGYVDSGDHCWHGTQELIMCVERDCSEYPLEIQPDGNCDEIESCQSGEKTTYKCNKCKKGWTGNGCHQKETCPYDTKECINGYEPTGNDCWSGDERFIECREVPCDGHTLESCPLNAERCSECKSDSVHLFKVESCKPGWEGEDCSTPSHCDYETLDCTGGYVATGNYCWSAGIKYTECKARECSFTTTSCEAGYEETGRTCQSAETLYRECQKITCPYHTIICAEGYHETGATCQSGSEVFKQCEPNDCGDYPLTDCPANAKGECERCQSGENIIRYRVKACKTGWTGQDCNTPDPSCTYRETSCDRTQGYEETGAYCYYGDQRYVECTAAVCNDPPYDYDRCPSNAQSCGMCVTEDETKYKIYSCKNGWEGADCGTAKTCGSGYEQTTCKDGYDQVGTPCQSGDVAYVKCEPKGCAGYNIDDACPANAESCGRCKSGEGYKYMVNSCKNGWTGERCDTPAACPYDKTECDGGYVPTGNKCKSGNTTYIECKEQTCGGYYESCGQGYVSVPGDTCQMGGKTLIRCKEKTCPAEYMESCPTGYEKDTSVEPCLSGQRRLYKCRAQSCDNYPATEQNIAHCTKHKSCQSGDQTKYRCDQCESGYTGDGAGRCKVIDSSTCVSEGYTYTEYGAGKECVTPGASKKCGDTTYYKCSVCKDGMKAVNGKCENQTEGDCNNQGFWYNNANKAEKGCATLNTASSCKAGSTDYYKCSTCATGWTGPNSFGYCSATACSEEEFPYTEFGATQDCVVRAGGAQNQCQSGSVTRYKCSECNTARFNKQPENGICVAKTEEGCREDGYAYHKTDVGADKDCTSYKQESDPDNYCWVGATQYVECTGCRDGMYLNPNTKICEDSDDDEECTGYDYSSDPVNIASENCASSKKCDNGNKWKCLSCKASVSKSHHLDESNGKCIANTVPYCRNQGYTHEETEQGMCRDNDYCKIGNSATYYYKDCNECDEQGGYVQDDDGWCSQCVHGSVNNQGGCTCESEAYDGTLCDECAYGYKPSGDTCIPDTAECPYDETPSNDWCAHATECNDGSYKCDACIPTKTHTDDSKPGYCVLNTKEYCEGQGYFSLSDLHCSQSSYAPCIVVNGNNFYYDKCSQCVDGYDLVDGVCVDNSDVCPTGQYKTNSGTCVDIPASPCAALGYEYITVNADCAELAVQSGSNTSTDIHTDEGYNIVNFETNSFCVDTNQQGKRYYKCATTPDSGSNRNIVINKRTNNTNAQNVTMTGTSSETASGISIEDGRVSNTGTITMSNYYQATGMKVSNTNTNAVENYNGSYNAVDGKIVLDNNQIAVGIDGGTKTAISNNGRIIITNTKQMAIGAKNAWNGGGTITIDNSGVSDEIGSATGIEFESGIQPPEGTLTGTVNIKNISALQVTGIKNKSLGSNTQLFDNLTLNIQDIIDSEEIRGIYTEGKHYIYGNKNITNTVESSASLIIGAVGSGSSAVLHSAGRIYIDSTKNPSDAMIYGIQVKNGATVYNGDEYSEAMFSYCAQYPSNCDFIKIKYLESQIVYGIYATNGSNIYNYSHQNHLDGGMILISVNPDTGVETVRICTGSKCANCNGSTCNPKPPYTYFDGTSHFYANNNDSAGEGVVDGGNFSTSSVGGVVMASTGSKFEIEKALSGEIMMSSEVVTNGFEDTYTVADMIDAGDVSGLSLLSQSALFDAELQNESDAVLKMKSFDDVVANKSIADFLQQNYQEGNNEAFFNLLKEQDTMTALRQTVDSLTGDDVFNRFNFEDMTMMRELNMDINNTLFNNEERHLTTAGSVAPFYFDSNSGSDGRYALYNTRVGQKSLGMSLAFTHVNSSDRHDDNSRKDETFQMSVPFGYNTHGFKFISAPRFGYAYGTYDRKGYNRTYDGTVEKRMFGLMNEARYPVNMGNWSLAPAVEFNMLGYHVKGHEKSAPYALNIPGQKNYSVEAGVGLYANKDMLFGKNQKLKMNLGVAAYHEFVDPYETELEMQGMSGKFTIRDERHKDNRTVVRGGFDYQYSEEMSLIGTIATFVDGTTHTNANLDFRYHF